MGQLLHEDLAESSVSSIFALFSTIMNTAVRARLIPASPCTGIRVTSADAERAEKKVATPVQFVRAALRMDDLAGYPGFVLTLLDGYTGARWSELISQKPAVYDHINKQFPIRRPIREAAGQFEEAPRTKSPAGRRWIQLPPFLALLYEALIEPMPAGNRVFTGARGAMLRRGNFTRRFWRPAWDGDPGNTDEPVPAVLTGFTFHEGRHTQRTWLAEDNIPDIARAARLGQKLPGMADVYEHVTPAMIQDVLAALQNRWVASLNELTDTEYAHLQAVVPADIRTAVTDRDAWAERVETHGSPNRPTISRISPATA